MYEMRLPKCKYLIEVDANPLFLIYILESEVEDATWDFLGQKIWKYFVIWFLVSNWCNEAGNYDKKNYLE